MARKAPDPRWQPKSLWTERHLAELSKEVGKLRQKVREAEATRSKASPSGARRFPSGHVPQH
jgi:hypothetical protein